MQNSEISGATSHGPIQQKGFSIKFLNENEGEAPRSNFAYTSQIRNLQKSMFESNFVSTQKEKPPDSENKEEEKQGPKVTYIKDGQTVTKHVS